VGGPSWIGADRFDITATMPEGAAMRDLPVMLQALLADRFRLAVHAETRETPMYALVVARGDGRLGPQLKNAPLDCEIAAGERSRCSLQVSDKITGRGQRMSALARMLAQFAGRPVIDRTGLAGGFDFDLESPDIAGGPRATGPDSDSGGGIFTALEEQLGLKLSATKGPLEFVVIDSAERPTED
jgi:uncharacterized protein (TIGR03435 family)